MYCDVTDMVIYSSKDIANKQISLYSSKTHGHTYITIINSFSTHQLVDHLCNVPGHRSGCWPQTCGGGCTCSCSAGND
jgi:hypothetical protein